MHGHKIVNQNSLHFITLTVVGWIDVFTRDEYRRIFIDSLKHCQHEKGLVINAYVIMSNHVHLMCYTKSPNLLSNVLRDLKRFTSKSIVNAIQENVGESRKDWMLHQFEYHAKFNKNNTKYQFWQQDNRPIELITPKWINQKLNYIHLNPVRNGLVSNAYEYIYSSASDYLGNLGLLEIELLDSFNTIGFIDS